MSAEWHQNYPPPPFRKSCISPWVPYFNPPSMVKVWKSPWFPCENVRNKGMSAKIVYLIPQQSGSQIFDLIQTTSSAGNVAFMGFLWWCWYRQNCSVRSLNKHPLNHLLSNCRFWRVINVTTCWQPKTSLRTKLLFRWRINENDACTIQEAIFSMKLVSQIMTWRHINTSYNKFNVCCLYWC